MPLYEYSCASCKHVFEVLIMSASEADTVRCSRCQSPDVSKLMSAANFSGASSASSTSPAQSSGACTSCSSHNVQSHSCGSGSCTSFELSGHKKA